MNEGPRYPLKTLEDCLPDAMELRGKLMEQLEIKLARMN